jgi:hypothetical protein
MSVEYELKYITYAFQQRDVGAPRERLGGQGFIFKGDSLA